MKVNFDTSASYKPNFGAKVSERFVNTLRRYFSSGENRLKKNYLLSKKISDYESFGHDEYTVGMIKKELGWTVDYLLVAFKDGMKPDDYIILAKRDSFRKIVEKFMKIRRSEFNSRLGQQG